MAIALVCDLISVGIIIHVELAAGIILSKCWEVEQLFGYEVKSTYIFDDPVPITCNTTL